MKSIRGEECRIHVNEEIKSGETSSEVAARDRMDKVLKEVAKNHSEKLKRWKETSIYMIPRSLKDLNEKAYKPQMVAIGPYHHGDEQLKGMEEHKMRAVINFLGRSGKSFEFYKTALTPSLQAFKNAYQELQTRDDDFLEMMIVDGCFMLELMRTFTDPKRYGYAVEDPIFSEHGRLYLKPYLKRDMLMLENQIPMRVLKQLLVAGGLLEEKVKLTKWILEFCDRKERNLDIKKLDKCPHILYLYRKSLLKEKQSASSFCKAVQKDENDKEKEKEEEEEENEKKEKKQQEIQKPLPSWCCLVSCCRKKEDQDSMRSVTELSKAWIILKKSKTTFLDDIEFKGRDLKLSRVQVDDATKHLYLNLMALERLHVNAGNEVTSYVYFMDKLIDSAEDVSLLHWRGIMENLLGTDQEVANLFNNLSTDICLDKRTEFYRVQEKVADYYRMPLLHCVAYAQHTYFTNPWVLLSVVAAIFLFALTIVQTVYAILDYRKP